MNPASEPTERPVQEQRNRGGYFTAFLMAALVLFAVGAIYLLIIFHLWF